MANEFFYDAVQAVNEITSLPGKRIDDFMDQTRRYQDGDIGVADQMLMGGANAVGMLTDVPLASLGKIAEVSGNFLLDVVDSVTPESFDAFLKKGISDLKEGVMETEAAKIALKTLEENPQWVKRLGYLSDLSTIPASRVLKKNALPDLSLEAPNRQPSFYGSGTLGQISSIARTTPAALAAFVNPRAAASRRGGVPMSVRNEAAKITPERQEKHAELSKKKPFGSKKEGPQRTEKEQEWVMQYRKDLSFLEGQLDQTQLISKGRGLETQGVVKSFEKVQQLDSGVLNPAILSTATSFSNLSKKDIELTKDNFAVIEEKMRKDQKIEPTEEVKVVVRNPTAFSDVSKEGLKGPSKEATRIFYARASMQKHFPEKTTLTDADLKEFVALTKLPDDTLYRMWGTKKGIIPTKVPKKDRKKANALDRKIYKYTESDIYGTNKRADKDTIEMYFKYKRMEQNNKKFTKPQQKIYAGMKARVLKASESLDQRGDTVYFNGSHKSSAKGLGGVNDQFMLNRQGNFVHFMNDENDLFGYTVPGDSRVLSVLPPTGYNVFAPVGGKVTPGDKSSKQVFVDELSELGATPVNKEKTGMLQQAAEGIKKQEIPSLRASDFENLGASSAVAVNSARALPTSEERMLTQAPNSNEYLAAFKKGVR
tara:strand:- start:8 stop:1966 length:1959 start_codon:yes stop_codon:yes gene_type:complete